MKKYYQKFLKAHGHSVHLAAHSHHFWPDKSLDGHIEYWEDSAKFSDQKWEKILGQKLPKVQKLISRILHYPRPSDIAFAPNTHELLYRLFSGIMNPSKPLRVLTSDSEFHSFSRQLNRWEEAGLVHSTKVDSLAAEFESSILEKAPEADVIFISQVFFNSGKVLNKDFFQRLVDCTRPDTVICIDGYHGFCAIPFDLAEIYDRVFYIAGGYKYAQAGEGMCFMTLPRECKIRPLNTGWWANFADLEGTASTKVNYSNDGMKFMGSTQDLSSMYRFIATWENFYELNLGPEKIHSIVSKLMEYFVENVLWKDKLLIKDPKQCGHFLTLELPDAKKCEQAWEYLGENRILTDYRNNRLRFGFAPYLDKADIDRALVHLNSNHFLNLLT